MDQSFDMIVKGGRVIDPASGMDGLADVAITAGRIAAVGPDIPAEAAAEVIDATGRVVIAGMIDTHAHIYQHVTGRFGLNADMVGVQSGVTTVLDQAAQAA